MTEDTTRRRLAVGFATGTRDVAVFATALSLSDLADSIESVAHIASWKAHALATALDLNFICTEAFTLLATAAVAQATSKATTATKAVTLLMSAVANSWAMAHTADGPIMQAVCIAARVAVPCSIALATFTLGKAVRALMGTHRGRKAWPARKGRPSP